MSRLPLSALAAFEAAARQGSMTRAAEELGLTHGAVSKQVGDLEKRLGVRLFERTPKGLVPTDAGRELARSCTSGFGRMGEAWDRIASGGPQRLRIAAPRSWTVLWLLPRLGRFLADWPGVSLDLDGENKDRPTEAEAGWVVVRYVRGGDPLLPGTILSDEPLFPVCAPDLRGRLEGWPDLAGVPLLHFSSSPDWSLWRGAAGASGLGVTGGLTFSDSFMVMRAAEDGLGVAMGRPSLVAHAVERGHLVCPFGPVVDSGDRYVLTAPQEGQGRPVVRAFRRWLLAEAAETVRLFGAIG